MSDEQTPFDAVLDDNTLSIHEQVDAFRDIAKHNEQGKRLAGRRLYWRLRRKGDKPLLRRFLLAFNAYDSDYNFIRFTGDRARHAASFRAAMTMRTRRMKKLGRHTCPEWMLWDKPEGARFAKTMGVHVAAQLDLCPRAKLEFLDGTAIKPVDGSQSMGVYLIFGENRIGDVWRNETFSGYDELSRRLDDDLESGRVPKDNWIIEKLMTNAADPAGIAVDWKFHMFYGEILLIGMMRRFPAIEQVWFNLAGEKVDLGFTVEGMVLEPPVIPETLLKTAQAISLAVPAPFLRVDLLDTDQGPALGEFTARPQYWHKYGRSLDLEFGDGYIAAEARLQDDLLGGKDFGTWKEFIRNRPV